MELVIAVVILSLGVLGLAATTGVVIQTVTVADLQTERAAAAQYALERIRATPFDSIAAGADTVGRYQVAWRFQNLSTTAKRIWVATRGPGQQSSGAGMPVIGGMVADSTSHIILRP